MAEKIQIEVTDKVAASINVKLEQIAASARSGHDAVTRLQQALASIDARGLNALTTAQARIQASMNQSALASQRLATEQQRTAIATQQVAAAQARATTAATQTQIATQRLVTTQAQSAAAAARTTVAQNNAAVSTIRLQQAQQRLERSARSAAQSLLFYARSAIAVGLVALTGKSVFQLADSYTTLQNKLRVVAETEGQVATLTQKLFEISNRTRTPIEETATAFSRFDRAMQLLGRSQSESIRLTETVNKSLITSGANTAEAAAGLLQLSQAFNKGKLDGDEFRTVMELMPDVTDAIAKQLRVTRGELLKLAPQGKITAQVLADALKNAADTIDQKFQKTIPTISQAFTILGNNITKAFGEFNRQTGFAAGISQAILAVANNLDKVKEVLITVGIGFATYFGVSLLANLSKVRIAILAINLAVRANPIGLLITGLTLAASYFVIFEDGANKAKDAVSEFGKVLDRLIGYLRAIGIFLEKQGLNFEDLLHPLDAIAKGGLIRFRTIGQSWAEALKEGMESQGNFFEKAFTGNKPFSGKGHGPIKSLGDGLRGPGTPPPESVSTTEIKRAEALRRINAELDTQLDRLFMLKPEREIQANFDRIELDLLKKKITLQPQEANAIKEKITALQLAQSVQEKFDSIYENAVGPLREYTETLKAATELEQKGAEFKVSANRAIVVAREAYLDSLDPLRQTNKELDDQIKLLGMLPLQREAEQQVIQIVNEQLAKGNELSKAEIELLRDKIILIQSLNLAAQEESALYDATFGARAQYVAQLEAITKFKEKLEGFSAGDAAQAIIAANPDFDFENTQTMFDANIQRFEDMYERIQILREKDLINEQTAAALRAQVWAQQQAAQLQTASTFFSALSQLQHSENKKMARIGKAAAIAQAVIDTYKAANAAYASLAGVPIIGPALGVAAAAAAIAAGLANVQAIRKQGEGFQLGGWTGHGPVDEIAGTVHRREYVMDSGSTSRIGVANLNALRTGAARVSSNSKQVGSNTQIKVDIKNYGTSKQFQVEQLSANEIRIIARDEATQQINKNVPELVAGEMANPNSKVSKAMTKNTQTVRRR